MIQIAPSVLACDFTKLGDEVASIERGGADMVHLDVMDGVFVDNISFGLPVISSLRKQTGMVFDVHLMITEPERYIEKFIDAGADVISFHLEACADVTIALDTIRLHGKRAAIAIKPATPVETVFPYLEKCDMILIMTVEPGHGGQALIPETLQKVTHLRAELARRGLTIDIEVDGGISPATSSAAIAAGANVLVAGSAVFRATDRKAAMDAMRTGDR